MVAAHTACLLLSDVRLILTIPGREALPRAQPGGSEPDHALASGSKAQRPSWAMAWPSGWGPPSARVTLHSLAPRPCSRGTLGGHEGCVSL